MRLILASASPRRRALLEQLGVSFRCRPADIDETPHAHESPRAYVLRMAQHKAAVVARSHPAPEHAVLAADTAVVAGTEILGKPRDRRDALAMLTRLSGRRHRVLSAVCLSDARGQHWDVVETQVMFISLSRQVCEAYLDSTEPWDKAGAYAIQGLGGAFVRAISGSYSNVVGLPLCETWQLLAANGIATALDTAGK